MNVNDYARKGLSHVSVEGDLLPADVLNRIVNADSGIPGLKPEDYGLSPSERVNEAINRSWQRMRSLWTRFSAAREQAPEGATGTAETRRDWLLPLFDELGYGRLQPATAEQRSVEDAEGLVRTFAVSHMHGASPIHLVGFGVSLDRKMKGVTGAAKASPHSMMQEFLNLSDAHLWGFVSNGLELRVLRDCASLSRQAYIGFDLEGMFADQSFADFALLWMLCHQSRVERRPVEEGGTPVPEGCRLEQWTHAAQESAMEALDQLSGKVADAVQILGRGFLAENPALRDALASSLQARARLSLQDYFHQLLRLVYRLIFCFVAEDRALLHAPGTPKEARERYAKYWSFQRLRRLARRIAGTKHADMYEAAKTVMRLLGRGDGCPALGLSPMGGGLWAEYAMPDLMQAKLSNACLLEAIHALAWFGERGFAGVRNRPVDYQHLGARELGSIYESLLECHPVRDGETGFALKSAAGSDRKKTGAYYTPAPLIGSLLETALDPVLDRACRSQNPETALLELKVCDPACGSGHFLLAAARRIAERLATIRSGEEDPSPGAVRQALRDVVGRCIYGVDVNPMSVELCKVSLWMEAMEPGKPLSFLDHHVVCGNSLIGAVPGLIRAGLPDEAFEALEGDDKTALKDLKKRNKAERAHSRESLLSDAWGYASAVDAVQKLTAPVDFDGMPSDTLADVEAKEAAFRAFCASPEYARRKMLADMWCAAFVMPRRFDKETGRAIGITVNTVKDFANGKALPPELKAEIEMLSREYQFLHWDVAFPEVAVRGGFDVMLGNPPWERIKLQEKEWFAARVPAIADAPNAAARKKMIAKLKADDPVLYGDFLREQRVSTGASHFLRNSGRYPLCGRGDINMYAVFAENMRNSINDAGRVGCIVPSGIATDDTTKDFFRSMVETKSLVSLFDFENRLKIFPAIYFRIKFSLLTTGNGRNPLAEKALFVFFALSVEDARDPERRFSLSSAEIAQMNPNTRTCPVFRTRRDAELTKAAYRRVPVLVRERQLDANGRVLAEEQNPWGLKFSRMFDMSNDSALFRTRVQLEEAGGKLQGNHFFVNKASIVQTAAGPVEIESGEWLPLYEAKMTWFYNHRAADVVANEQALQRKALPVQLRDEELNNPNRFAMPLYWVSTKNCDKYKHSTWFLCVRAITSSTNERTIDSTCIPFSGVGNSLIILHVKNEYKAFLASILSSYVCDFFGRFKVGGINLNFFIAEQLAVLSPKTIYSNINIIGYNHILEFIRPRVLELIYTSWDMKSFAEDLGFSGPPFPWNKERRFLLQAELDAMFFHLYLPSKFDGAWKKMESETEAEVQSLQSAFSSPREAVGYIMDSFWVRKERDEKAFGSYRTKEEILRVYDAMQECMRTGMAYKSPLYGEDGKPLPVPATQ